MESLPDTQELLRTGLSPEKPYLGTFSVVEELVRSLLSAVTDIRARQLDGKDVDVRAEVGALCADFQQTFYGKNPDYLASAWNREDQLGAALVRDAGIEGDTSDAVERLAAKIVSDYLNLYVPFENEQMDDEQFQFGVDSMVEFFTHVLLGLPYEVD